MSIAIARQPAASGALSVVKTFDARAERDRLARLRRALVRDDSAGHFLAARERLLYETKPWDVAPFQQQLLTWLRDHIHPGIPRAWYRLAIGHDLHVSSFGELYVKVRHAAEIDPFTGDLGWTENVGLASVGKVTTAFRDLEAGYLVTDSTAYGDFKYHEVGTSATAEANTDTALVTSTGIARVAGTQTNPTASTYQSVATVTADTSETWQEHGLFNASSGVTLMDRSVLSPTATVVASDTVQFTYVLTKAAEA